MSSFWAIPCVIIMRLTKHIVLIRLGRLRSDRIGHFCIDAGILYANLNDRSNNIIDWYWLDPSRISNQFWKKMVVRNLPIYTWTYYVDYWNQKIPGGDLHIRDSSHAGIDCSRDIYGSLSKGYQTMKFLTAENIRAKRWLKRHGWKDGDKFVCFLVRDSSFLNHEIKTNPYMKIYNKDYNFDYHNYRDTDINTYIDAMEWLANNGVWVLRMGKVMAKRVESNNPKIIDYSFLSDKNDFMDIWLFAHCTACISTGTGLDLLSAVYNRPILLLNYIPLSYFFSFSPVTHYPKRLVWNKNGRMLNWSEYCKHGYLHNEQYDENGINIIDMSSNEILEAVKEFWMKLNYDLVDDAHSLKQQHIFIDIAKKINDYDKIHGFVHDQSRISTTFLTRNKNWLQ